MYYYRCTIAYKGTSFFGWQYQTNGKETVQEHIFKALRIIAKFKEVFIVGASRTDSGVHALGQAAKIGLPVNIVPDNLLKGLNSLLHNDIRIIQCEECDGSFNPIKDSISKEYHYYFSDKYPFNPQLRDIINFTSNSLDIELMKKGCELFIGTYDFTNFCRKSSNARTTIRTILNCEIFETSHSPFISKVYVLKVVGTGFLKQMVRYIAGTLLKLGEHKIDINRISEYLNNEKKDKPAPKAAAKGLHLFKVNYGS